MKCTCQRLFRKFNDAKFNDGFVFLHELLGSLGFVASALVYANTLPCRCVSECIYHQ